MMKRRKDSGFTLIELMIVIAVIGILAIVLVPKVGTVKTQAKETGLDVNVRAVQAYCESKITKWVSKDLDIAGTGGVAEDIADAFSGENKQLTNPITAKSVAAVSNADAAVDAGDYSVYVLEADGTSLSVDNDPDIDGPNGVTGLTNLKGSILVVMNGSSPVDEIFIYAVDENGEVLNEKTVQIIP